MQKEISDVNKRIKHYRILAGYTQETAAQALGMKKNTYAYMERYGSPTPDVLMKISQLFDVSVSELFYGKIKTKPLEQPPFPMGYVNSEQPQRLREEPFIFTYQEPPLILTAHEKAIMKIFKQLSTADKKRVMEFINEIYNSK